MRHHLTQRRRAPDFIVVLLILSALVGVLTVHAGAAQNRALRASGVPAVGRRTTPHNVVFVLTDDQRWDEIDFMPYVVDQLRKNGVVFRNAFVTNPVCCPVRASILSGGFRSRDTGVLTSRRPNGGVWRFHDTDTLATRLQTAGFATGLIGKYLNGYPIYAEQRPDNIPPGWTRFAVGEDDDWYEWHLYAGSSTPAARGRAEKSEIRRYSTDFLGEESLRFIDAHAQAGPFFLMFTPYAPHLPAQPSVGARDDEVYAQFATGGNHVYRGRGWGERPDGDVSDKPLYVRLAAADFWDGDASRYAVLPFLRNHRTPDELYAHRVQSLLAVDRAIQAIVERIDALGLLSRTLFIFSSDNGYVLGEHGIHKKNTPYEEAIRVPLIVWNPALPHKYVDAPVLMDLDAPATILDYAGLPPFAESDGQSLRGMMEGNETGQSLLRFENYWVDDRNVPVPGWSAVRDADWKYVEYTTGERELYDQRNDAFELVNVALEAGNESIVERYAALLRAEMGLSLLMPLGDFPEMEYELPPATRGSPYGFKFHARGGTRPYFWAVGGGAPAGLAIDSNGLLSGTPTGAVGRYTFTVSVTDASISPAHGGPMVFEQSVSLEVR